MRKETKTSTIVHVSFKVSCVLKNTALGYQSKSGNPSGLQILFFVGLYLPFEV